MADRMKKYEKSRLSFQEFAKLLNCESWYDNNTLYSNYLINEFNAFAVLQ